jgi:hypothetical protein
VRFVNTEKNFAGKRPSIHLSSNSESFASYSSALITSTGSSPTFVPSSRRGGYNDSVRRSAALKPGRRDIGTPVPPIKERRCSLLYPVPLKPIGLRWARESSLERLTG